MDTVHAIDKKIVDYLLQLSLQQKKAVLGIKEAFASSGDNEYDQEINDRIAEYENGSVEAFTFEESAARARLSYRASKKDH